MYAFKIFSTSLTFILSIAQLSTTTAIQPFPLQGFTVTCAFGPGSYFTANELAHNIDEARVHYARLMPQDARFSPVHGIIRGHVGGPDLLVSYQRNPTFAGSFTNAQASNAAKEVMRWVLMHGGSLDAVSWVIQGPDAVRIASGIAIGNPHLLPMVHPSLGRGKTPYHVRDLASALRFASYSLNSIQARYKHIESDWHFRYNVPSSQESRVPPIMIGLEYLPQDPKMSKSLQGLTGENLRLALVAAAVKLEEDSREGWGSRGSSFSFKIVQQRKDSQNSKGEVRIVEVVAAAAALPAGSLGLIGSNYTTSRDTMSTFQEQNKTWRAVEV